jgi:endonuclease G, mitochondrial
MAILTHNEVLELVDALVSSGLDIGSNRGALFQSIEPHFLATLPGGHIPIAQLLMDITQMSERERLANGEIPLQTYLQNASLLLSGAAPQQKIVRQILDLVMQRTTGAPRIDPVSIPEIKEKIIHTDDMVTFAFMESGLKAASAVMKLRVPSCENGKFRELAGGEKMIFLGTGWLLTESLLITNHHVINARKEGEANASGTDLQMQALGTTVQLDFDGDDLAGKEIAVLGLEASNETLDYAVVRIPATGRKPLRRAPAAISLGSEPIPVNIIQHPGGRSKRYGIRNNLVSAATATELRYFTDTEGGSSGSPVLNDRWEVVALHRASASVSGVQFQGKSTAYINLGTHLSLILDDLRQHFPAIAAEIEV